jgi:hypothetical protein
VDQDLKRKQCFLLRLPLSVRERAVSIAQNEGISLNHFIALAVAEKISRIEQVQLHPVRIKQPPPIH